jgi:endonuclease/exonuclease/phosphatase (EEP) superfamily protein YafD
MEISVMTFNVYMDGHKDKEAATKTVDSILESGADIVCTQESNPDWQEFMQPRISTVYPHFYFYNEVHAYGGRGILSKYPIIGTQWCQKVFPWWYGASLVNIDLGGGVEIAILNVHLKAPFPSNPFIVQAQRKQEIETHLKQLDPASLKNVIVLGDFNSARGPCHDYLQTESFTNALYESGKSWYVSKTWHMYGMVGFLFDHIYYKEESNLHLLDAEIRKVGGSDHWPLVAKFRIGSL